jgi:hypothetical protein
MDGNTQGNAGAHAESHREPKRKPWWRYWLARGVVIAGVALLIAVCVAASRSGNPRLWVFAWALVFFPPAMFALRDVLVFPFEYGLFGPYRRAPFPDEEPVFVGDGMSSLFFQFVWAGCRVFPSGVGVSIPLIGRAFIPYDTVEAVRWHPKGGCTISHSCPEFASPFLLYGRSAESAFRIALEGWRQVHQSVR